MFRLGVAGVLCVALAGCAQGPFARMSKSAPTAAVSDATAIAPGTSAPPPPRTAVTVEQFDTTTQAERAAAAQKPAAQTEKRIGTTIASLGDPSEQGFWAVTGLVDVVTQGRLEYPLKGTSVQVELRPSGAEAGAGTRVSLPALRVLEAPLTELPELVVYGG